MPRLLLLIILITVVYSWEEIKYALTAIWSKFRNRNTSYNNQWETDVLVSDIVLIATIPLTLAYLLAGSRSLPVVFSLLLAEFLVLSLVLRGIEEYQRRKRFVRGYVGSDRIVGTVFSLLGLVSPSWRFATSAVRNTSRTGRYLGELIMPLGLGLILCLAVRSMGREEFVGHMDVLIFVATVALVLNITIEVLERMFRIHALKITSLLRVGLGVVIVFFLFQ